MTVSYSLPLGFDETGSDVTASIKPGPTAPTIIVSGPYPEAIGYYARRIAQHLAGHTMFGVTGEEALPVQDELLSRARQQTVLTGLPCVLVTTRDIARIFTASYRWPDVHVKVDQPDVTIVIGSTLYRHVIH